ncbi:MAG: SDR family oxidoreductase [Alphaproteobacteria bacterium]|nr:MAG: SDR family oxidoreductase [Alphaproteobacteria bacterium]
MPRWPRLAEVGSSRRPDWPLAVVVGAGGMGMAIARRLGQTHRVLLADRDADHLDRQSRQLEVEGLDVAVITCDVTDRGDLVRLAETARTAGPVKSLAYVVGLSPSAGDFRQIMSVNLIGAASAVASFGEVLVPGGAALLISSSSAHMQAAAPEILALVDRPLDPDFLSQIESLLGDAATPAAAYVASKKGVIRLCQALAAAWGTKGLRILSLSPGLVATPMGAREYAKSPGKLRLFETVPAAREGTMLEIANVADFLLSSSASYISGTDILVDGGLIATLGSRQFD